MKIEMIILAIVGFILLWAIPICVIILVRKKNKNKTHVDDKVKYTARFTGTDFMK